MSKEKPIFFLTEQDVYNGNMPPYFDENQYSWVKILEDNYKIITDEFSEYIVDGKDLQKSSVNPPNLSNKNAWQNVYFWNFMWKKHDNCKKYPKTYQLLKSIPNLTFAEVTCLKGKSKILPHIGETNTTIRGHLGLKIPGKLPEMGISVNGIDKGWDEGKVILFSDAHRHHVWNNSSEDRFILVFDVIQDQFAHKKTWMCAQALSSLTIKFIDEKINFFNNLPQFLRYSFHIIFSALWFIYLPFQNKFSFLP